MHILIIELNHGGHRLTTVRVLLDALATLKSESDRILSITIATTRTGATSAEFMAQLAPVKDQFQHMTLPAIDLDRHAFFIGVQQVKNLRAQIEKGDFDHVYIPYADAVLQLLVLARINPLMRWWPSATIVEAQMMKSSFAYPFAKQSRRLFALLGVRFSGCHKVHLNDALGFDHIRQKYPNGCQHVQIIPDPISVTQTFTKSEARKKLNLSPTAKIVGCVGAINKRKGADTLINAFVISARPDDKLLLAGRQSPEIKSLLELVSDARIISIDRYISDLDLSLALSAVDLVATPYPETVGSASIIIRAAIAGRMVLTNDSGWAGYTVPKFGLGRTASSSDVEVYAAALAESLDSSINYTPSPQSDYFCKFNSVGNIHAHWTSLIRCQLGLGQDSRLVRWEQ